MDDFSKVQIGDRLYSLLHGEVIVLDIRVNFEYSIVVQTKERNIASFTTDGRYYAEGDQLLFWGKPSVVGPPMPPRMVKRWIVGCYGYDGKIFINGFGRYPTLFESAEEAGDVTRGSNIAFVVEVEVNEDALT